jgi:endonuclease-8
MEGPSLVIACEELKPFLKKKIKKARGSAKLPFSSFKGASLLRARSWGKHLLLFFSNTNLRIHFLMFGSYRIDDPRENRIPKLQLDYGDQKIYFYSCAIKEQPKGFEKAYDWSVDLMSPKWDPAQAVKALQKKPEAQVCDVLMDQNIFSGLGNIMKNEILFNLKMHPETQIQQLTPARQRKLVAESESYAWRFYEWKKANVLKRNWRIMRKKICPICEGKVKKKATGKLQRWSHFCSRCQIKA